MEKNEKVQYGIIMFLSTLSYSYTQFTYTTGLANSLKDLVPWIDMVVYLLLGLVFILIALDFIAAGMVPDKIVELLTWIYVLILGIIILVVAVLNQLKL